MRDIDPEANIRTSRIDSFTGSARAQLLVVVHDAAEDADVQSEKRARGTRPAITSPGFQWRRTASAIFERTSTPTLPA